MTAVSAYFSAVANSVAIAQMTAKRFETAIVKLSVNPEQHMRERYSKRAVLIRRFAPLLLPKMLALPETLYPLSTQFKQILSNFFVHAASDDATAYNVVLKWCSCSQNQTLCAQTKVRVYAAIQVGEPGRGGAEIPITA